MEQNMPMYKVKIIEGKMMLISQDIQVSDKARNVKFPDKEFVITEILDAPNNDISRAWSFPTEGKIVYSDLEDNKNGFYWRPIEEVFKVIGPISPDATWVKEGDNFDENQLEIPNGEVPIFKGIPNCIKIKGPCGHYH